MSSYFAGRLSKEISASPRHSSGRGSAPLRRNGPFLAVGFTILLTCLPRLTSAQAQPVPQSPSQPTAPSSESLPAGSPTRGEEFFAGQAHFRNGGPPCSSCHSIAGLPFPNGGTLGPDLTGVYHKLGAQGMQTAMKTLYFHVMTSIYDAHPLTLQERADLVAFFEEASTEPKPHWNTQIVALIAFIGFLILLLITHFVWRDRLKSVRRTMVERAMRQGGFHS